MIESHPYNGKAKDFLEESVAVCLDAIIALNGEPFDGAASHYLEAIANKFAHAKMNIKPFLSYKPTMEDDKVDVVKDDSSEGSNFDVSKLVMGKGKQRASWKSGSLEVYIYGD